MKLWSSFVKELKIASRGFYFYIELAMAFVLLFVVLFVVPEQFASKEVDYLYLNFPTIEVQTQYTDTFEDLDGKPEQVTIKSEQGLVQANLYESEERKIYVFATQEEMVRLAEEKHTIGAAVRMDADDYELQYTYYLQGNETKRLKNLILILHGKDDAQLIQSIENQPVHQLAAEPVQLNDRENLLPVFLAFNGALMGFFIIAAYLFLDKKEGVVKAYAVTPSPVWQYLLSKVMVLSVTMLLTSLLLIVPLMGARINYLVLLAFLLCTGLFASGLGLVLASYYDDIEKSFGVMYLLMIGLMLPALAYFMPSWNPLWLKFVPSYYIVFGFKEIFLQGDMGFVMLLALGYLAAGTGLFVWASVRHKRTMSV